MRFRRLAETIHVTALGIWLGALLMTGAGVAVIFPTTRDQLDPTLATFPNYTGEHWSLGAGIIAAKLFFINDIIQFVCAFLAFATLGLGLMIWVRRSPSGVIRALAMAFAMALVSYWLFILTPQMHTHLETYWQAAAAGDNELATNAKAAFDRLHPVATKAMGAQAALVLIALLAGVWSATGPTREQERPGTDGHVEP